MRDKSRIQDRRHRDRVKMNYPATYTRYDRWGNPCDQKIVKVADVNLEGVRLQSSFRLEPQDILDVTLALGENLISFRGKVIHSRLSKEHDYELGVSIEDIDDEQRATLIRFLSQIPNLAGN